MKSARGNFVFAARLIWILLLLVFTASTRAGAGGTRNSTGAKIGAPADYLAHIVALQCRRHRLKRKGDSTEFWQTLR
jgi:hypothetical protein